MTEDEVERVRRSWATAAASAALTGALFYGRLFRTHPELRDLFPHDLKAQERKLVQTLGFVVDALDDPDRLTPAAEALAARHVGYGVKAEHYAPVGDALVWTLGEMLGDAFEPEDRAAWAGVYGALAGAMIRSAYPDHGAGAEG